MSILMRMRRQSHPPPGEEEPVQRSPPPLLEGKRHLQRMKSAVIESDIKPTKHLTRSSTMSNRGSRSKPVVNNKMAFNVVEDLLECKLCKQRLQRPKMLPCQHTFCLTCLQACVQPQDTAIQCPQCKLKVDLKVAGPDGIAELPPNLYLDSFLTALKHEPVNVNENEKAGSRCAKCQTVGATSCQHCRKAFCLVCWPSHVSELKSQLPSLQDQLQAAKESLDHRKQDFQDVCQKLKAHIDLAVEIKIQSLRVEQDKLNKKTNKQTFSQVDRFLQLHRMTSDLLQEVSQWGETRPTFNEESFQIDMGDTSKSANDSEDADDVFYEDVLRNVDQTNSPDALSLYYRSRSFIPRINLGRSVLQRPAGVGVAPWDDGIHMYIAGTDGRQVLVIDRNRMKLVRQLTASNMLYPHGIAFSKLLREVFITDKWNHCVHVFSAEGAYLRQLGKKGHADGFFQSPEGIASGPGANGNPEEDYIYVCDTGNDRVQVLEPRDGSVVRIIGILDPLPGSKYKRTEFNGPTGIAVTSERVIVADRGHKRIKIYSLMGEKLNEFGSMGEAQGQFRAPECVSVDRLGFILVGDSSNARVQIFKPNGTLVKSFGGKGKFAGVTGITVTNNMDIIVTDYKGGSVQIF
ncbi:hypothetical protein C0J52_08692 [Blattella germanica]|nr:hypothetical protein C0J52_08692 [Blattella germanica]